MTNNTEAVTRWKFELRQTIVEYGSAVKADDKQAIKETSQRGSDLINAYPCVPSPEGEALALLKELEPHLDNLICYASTTTEYPVNNLVHRVYELLHKHRQAPEEST